VELETVEVFDNECISVSVELEILQESVSGRPAFSTVFITALAGIRI
jgi:hypothetical protein